LSSTHLLEIPSSIFDLDSLTHLNLGGNSITLSVEEAGKLSEMTQLNVLDLNNNPLGEVPDFTHMNQLQQLNLRNTRLSTWPSGLETLQELTNLDLRENNLTALPQSYFQLPPERLRSTYVHGNPCPPPRLKQCWLTENNWACALKRACMREALSHIRQTSGWITRSIPSNAWTNSNSGQPCRPSPAIGIFQGDS
jgi:Leucine-rich repeat (LRR) protein